MRADADADAEEEDDDGGGRNQEWKTGGLGLGGLGRRGDPPHVPTTELQVDTSGCRIGFALHVF